VKNVFTVIILNVGDDMSVEYEAKFGIGYWVEGTDAIPEDDLADGLYEYISDECGTDFDSMQVGNLWSGVMGGILLVIANPFEDGLDLTAGKEALDEEVARLNLIVVSEFGLIGGVLTT